MIGWREGEEGGEREGRRGGSEREKEIGGKGSVDGLMHFRSMILYVTCNSTSHKGHTHAHTQMYLTGIIEVHK